MQDFKLRHDRRGSPFTPARVEILTNSIRENAHRAIRPLSDEGIEFVSVGCFGIPVSNGHGGITAISPTIGPFLPGTRPTSPTCPTGPFPA
jgi:hypothetical protein